jgi:hypothetical protein
MVQAETRRTVHNGLSGNHFDERPAARGESAVSR